MPTWRAPSAAFVSTVIVLLTVAAMAQGVIENAAGQGGDNRMDAQLAVADRLLQYSRGGRPVNFSTSAFGVVNNETIKNVLLFERGFTVTPEGDRRGPVCLVGDLAFQPTEALAWAALPGRSDAQKINLLGVRAAASLDLIVVPDTLTATSLQRRGFICPANQHAPAIARSILTHGDWQRCGPPIVVSPNEVLNVYRQTPKLRSN